MSRKTITSQSDSESGAKKLPDWLTSAAPEALRTLVVVATGKTVDANQYQIETAKEATAGLRIKAAIEVCDRVFGKAAPVQPMGAAYAEMPDQRDLIAQAENILWGKANQGDTKALLAILGANDPRYAAAGKDVADTDSVDTVDFVPAIAGK